MIKDNPFKNAPTAEEININIYFKYWNLLYFLFPKTFRSEKEADDFYKNYCARAKELNEKEEIYKIPFEYYVNYKIDMLSGLVMAWNSYNNSPQKTCSFCLLDFMKIENFGLHDEILNIYEENFEHLEKLGVASRLSTGDVLTFNNFVIDVFAGLLKNTHYFPHFCSDTFKWEKETEKEDFFIPTESIIIDLRKIKTNEKLLENRVELESKLVEKYDKYNCKFNLDDFEAEINTKMFKVYIKPTYYYPAQEVDFSLKYPNVPYKDIIRGY